MSDPIIYKKDGAISWIIFNRPEARNALNYEMADSLETAIDLARRDSDVRVTIVTGEGNSFMAGSDIKELSERDVLSGWANSQRRQRIFSLLDSMEIPTIAAINGFALGAGCEVAASCSLRLAARQAKFGQLEINLGLIPGAGGTQRLPRLIGKGRALELLLTGKMINAEEAFRIGLVNQVVDDTLLKSEAFDLAMAIAQKSPMAVKGILKAVSRGLEGTIDIGNDIESGLFGICLSTKEAKDALRSFLERKGRSAH